MKKHFYLCGDKKAYNFALKNYVDEDTEIAFCKMNDDTDAACRLMFENIDKEFYIFGHCRSGYFKVELKTYMSLEPNTIEGLLSHIRQKNHLKQANR